MLADTDSAGTDARARTQERAKTAAEESETAARDAARAWLADAYAHAGLHALLGPAGAAGATARLEYNGGGRLANDAALEQDSLRRCCDIVASCLREATAAGGSAERGGSEKLAMLQEVTGGAMKALCNAQVR